jgi:hypothetical protein
MKRTVLVEQEQDVCDLHHGEDIVAPVTKAIIQVGEDRVEWDVCDSHARTIRSWMMMKAADTTPVKAATPVRAKATAIMPGTTTKTRTRATAKKAVAKKTAAKKTTASRRASSNGYVPREVRTWAAGAGVEMPKNGPIPKAVVDQYKAAMATA